MTLAALSVVCVAFGIALFFLLFRGLPDPGLTAFALGTGLVAAYSVRWAWRRPAPAQAVGVVASAASSVATPALLVILFVTGLHGTLRRKVLVFSSAAVATALRVEIWVIDLGPSRPVEIVVFIVMAQVAALTVAAAGGCVAGAIREDGERAAHLLSLELSRQRDEQQAVRRRERMRVARDLHDSIGQRIALLHIYASALSSSHLLSEMEALESSKALLEATHGISADLTKLIRTVRNETGEVMTSPLTSMREAIDRVRPVAAELGMTIHIDIEEKVLVEAPLELSSAVVDFVAEATTNAVKHGMSGPIFVRVTSDSRELSASVISVSGRPVSNASLPGGLGLIALRERADALGGSFSAEIEQDTFAARFTLPCTPRRPQSRREYATDGHA